MKRVIFYILPLLFLLPTWTQAAVVNRSAANFLTSGLVADWTFDGRDIMNGTVRDVSGRGNHGTLVNISSTTFYMAGKIGQGVSFDGADDYVTVADSTSLTNIWDGGGTVSFWVKPRSGGEADAGFWLNRSAWTVFALQGCVGNPGLEFNIQWSGSTGKWRDCMPLLTYNSWHHIVISYNADSTGNDPLLYIDGISVSLPEAVAPSGTRLTDTGNTLELGSNTATSRASDGVMDEVRIYRRILSVSEVGALYGQGAGKINTAAREPLKLGEVGHWTFDGKDMVSGLLKDVSGNGNNGNFAGIASSTFFIPGKIGQGVHFDGVNDGINLGSGSSVDDIQLQGGGGMTVAFWIKPDSNTTSTIIGKGSDANNSGTWIVSKNSATTPARITFKKEGATDSSKNYNSQVSNGVWTHIVITWNGSMTFSTSVLLYNNGILVVQPSATDGATPNSDAAFNLNIGSTNGLSDFCDCSLDDVHIYNHVLTSAEIQQLYNQSAGKFNASVKEFAKTGLAGYWTFDGKDMPNGRASDMSGNGNTGYLVSTATSTVYVPGKIGQGLNFDGINDSIDAGSNSSLNPTTGITLSAWVYPTASVEGGIISNGVAFGTNKGYNLFIENDGKIYCDIGITSTANRNNVVSYALNKWNHIVCTYDAVSGIVTVYKDSVSTSAAQTAGNIGNSGFSTSIGRMTGAGSTFFPGKIDDVRIYSRAFTASEVSKLYNFGK